MKIVGFAQLRNELHNGHLRNWFRCMEVCDSVYIYDQNSEDMSCMVYEEHDNTVVTYAKENNFGNEIACKQALLEKLLEREPDTDWILWMDGDTLLDNRLLVDDGAALHKMLEAATSRGEDGIQLGHYNLWRSDTWYRTDNAYHDLHKRGVLALWRNNGKLAFDVTPGLHKPQYPQGMENIQRYSYDLVHRGFAEDLHIYDKYRRYKALGQNGWSLERLLDDDTLTVEAIPKGRIPEWFEIQVKGNPTTFSPIRKGFYGKHGQ